jgi:vacuolar-type H+-ATPase subunit I/STV1
MDIALFDYLMPVLAHTAWKILCCIIRETRGWQIEEKPIPYRVIMKASGIRSPGTVKSGLSKLKEMNVISVSEPSESWVANSYRLNRDFELEIPTSKNEVPTSKNEVLSTSKNEVHKDIHIKKDTKKGDQDFVELLPDKFAQSDNFLKTWKEWVKFRKEIRKKLTKTAATRQLIILEKWPEDIAIAMVSQSINNSWQGIFELNERHPLMQGRDDIEDASSRHGQQLRSA